MIIARRGFLLGLGASLVAAPAVVHSANIMPVRNFLILPDFGWESFVPPSGMAYQWVARTLMGEPISTYIEPMMRAGWRPVDAKRYNKRFAIKGNEIEMGGQVLMEAVKREVAEVPYRETIYEIPPWEEFKRTGFKMRMIRPDERPNPFLRALLDAPVEPDRSGSVAQTWITGWSGRSVKDNRE